MIAENEMLEALDEPFRAALLLTGSAELAETAVEDGIAALESDQISAASLLLQTVKAAIARKADFPEQFEQDWAILPRELRRVVLLPANPRHAFVLRILLGMSPERSSEILDLSVDEVERALRAAIQELPFIDRKFARWEKVCTLQPRSGPSSACSRIEVVFHTWSVSI